MSERRRIDRLLVERGLFDSRAKAQAAIEAGLVQAGGAVIRKASDEIAIDAALSAVPAHPYVSRGGVKLAAALDHFGFDPRGETCIDAGASTGGFTQVLLERGAARVYAVDAGSDQLHAKLRGDPRVTSRERQDIRTLRLDEAAGFLVADVSFISLKLVLPALTGLAKPQVRMVALIKPQFEAGPEHNKKGVVRDPAIRDAVCKDIEKFAATLGWHVRGVIPSPIEGGDGNREFLLGATRG